MKKVGIIKRIFSLLLIFLLSINSFAAVVSDNDGSAFITKAEFDSLKNNFQTQIDQYNTSIDSKIDGAIASYLSGISLSTKITPRVLIPKNIVVSGTSNNILYWSGKTDYVFNSEEEYVPKMVGIWNLFYYDEFHDDNPDPKRKDANINEQLIGKRRDANRYKPVIWIKDDGFVDQVSNTQVVLTFSGQLSYRSNSTTWGLGDSTFGMTTGWNNGKIFGMPIFAGAGHGPLVDPTDTAHYYANYWYSYVYMFNTSIETDTSSNNLKFNVAPLGATDDYMKLSSSNLFDFYWQQVNINTDDKVKKANCGSETDLTSDFWAVDTYVGWNKTGIVSGVWDTKLRLWTKKHPSDLIWPFFTSIDSENKEIKKGIKLCEIDKNGDLSIDIKCSKDGYVIIYNAVSPDIYWTDKNLGKTRISETDMSWKDSSNCYQVTANIMENITLSSVQQNDKLWILYLPGGFTGSGGSWVGVDDGVIDNCDVTLTVEN